MKPSDVSRRIGLAPATVRAWSNQFARFFSPTGAGGEGRHRAFTEHDIAILNFIKAQKSSGATSDEVMIRLESLAASDYADLPTAPESINVASVPMIPTIAADRELDAERRALYREIQFLRQQIDQLKAENAADRESVVSLTGRLASAETELELWRSGRLK